MPSALILIANGTEEMEFTIVYDTLVRAGLVCSSAFVPASDDREEAKSPPFVKCSRGVNIMPDFYLDARQCGPDNYSLLVIPGGAQGAETISKSVVVQQLVKDYIAANKLVGMICAGSLTALTSKLPRHKLTSHPSVKAYLEKDFDYLEDPVVSDGNLVTSRGPGTSFLFAFHLIERLLGSTKVAEVREPMMFAA